LRCSEQLVCLLTHKLRSGQAWLIRAFCVWLLWCFLRFHAQYAAPTSPNTSAPYQILVWLSCWYELLEWYMMNSSLPLWFSLSGDRNQHPWGIIYKPTFNPHSTCLIICLWELSFPDLCPLFPFISWYLIIWFNLIFILILILILIFIIVIYFFLIIFLTKIVYLSYLVLIIFIVIYFIWNNLWNCNYYFLISSSFNLFIC
jgi:hypothetical protein